MDNFKKIKVLHLHTLPVISGSGINTFLTMKLSDKNRFESSLACKPGGKLQDLVEKYRFRFYPIPDFTGPVNPVKDIKSLIQVYKLLKTNCFDIIHTHNSKAGFIGRLAAQLYGKNKIKIVHTVHGFSFHFAEKWYRRYIFLLLEKLASNWSHNLIFISQPLIDWAKKYNLIKCPYYKIYSGIELDNFKLTDTKQNLRKKFGFNKEDFIIGEVAKLWEGKGHKTIIKSALILKNKIPNLKVLFVGEGYLREELEYLVKKYKLKNTVIFTGFIENVSDITSVMDIGLLISDFEGMGRVILESMLCKTPIIATNVGGIVDLIENEKTGMLVPPNNPEILADKILYLYNNKDLRYDIIKNAFKQLDEKFSAEQMVQQINEVYLTK